MSKEDMDLILTGQEGWKEFRDTLIRQLKKAITKEKFMDFLKAFVLATSRSEEEMQKKRRSLGLPET